MKHSTQLTYAERLDRLNTMIAENRILRGTWADMHEGRERACLLAAISPEVASSELPRDCPADVMHVWLAYLTPSIDQNVSYEYWPTMLREYASCVALFPKLDEKAWRRVQAKFLVACLDVALPNSGVHVGDVERVRALCVRASAGDEPSPQEWREAHAAAASEASPASEAGWASLAAAEAAMAAAAKAAAVAAWTAWTAAAWDTFAKALFAAIREEAT